MADHRIPVLIHQSDGVGSVFIEAFDVAASVGLINTFVWRFDDSLTRDLLLCSVQVPETFVSGAELRLVWYSTATAGDIKWSLDYIAAGAGDDFDPAAVTRTVDATAQTVPASAFDLAATTITLFDVDLAVNDEIRMAIARDHTGSPPEDTAAGPAMLVSAHLKFSDV